MAGPPPPEQRPAAPTVDRQPSVFPEEERKTRVLTHGRSSITRGIADAVVIKEGNLFFLCQPDGQVPLSREHGYGLYSDDCRFLNGYRLSLDGGPLNLLASSAHRGYEAALELTNHDLLDAAALCDEVTVTNFTRGPVEVELAVTLRAEFEDVLRRAPRGGGPGLDPRPRRHRRRRLRGPREPLPGAW